MKPFLTQLFVCLFALIAVGGLRMAPEQALTNHLREEKLLPPPLNLSTREKLGQKGLVASLGGLRPTLASIDHIRAVTHQYNGDLYGMEEAIQSTVALEPHIPFYWDTGAWMLAYNASAYCRDDITLPPLRRSVLQKQYIEKGYDMLEKSIQTNPDIIQLRLAQGRLAGSQYHLPDYVNATRIYREALAAAERQNYPEPVLQHIRLYILYNLCKVQAKSSEAYHYARHLYDSSTDYHFPSLRGILFALQYKQNISTPERVPDHQLLGSRAEGINLLTNYAKREKEGYPMNGVTETLQQLKAQPMFPLAPTDTNSFHTPMRR